MKPIVLIALICSFSLLSAQTNGLILEDEAYEATAIAEIIDDSIRGKLPLVVDLRPFCPKAGDQGDLPSCVAWALANALTIQKAQKEGVEAPAQVDKMRFSVAYIYNQIKYKGYCNLGASFTVGLELLKYKGDCPAVFLPYSQDCDPMPNYRHHNKAYPYRIKAYHKVFERHASKNEKIDNILDALALNHPVLIAMNVPFDFRTNIPALYTPWLAEDPHAMVIVGYDDRYETFTILNSYGPDWGDNGFFEIDWDTLGKWVRYGFVIE